MPFWDGAFMTRYFTAYWKNDSWTRELQRGATLNHTAANNFRSKGVAPGDVVYIVTVLKGELYVGGKIVVERVVSQKQAEEAILGENLWNAVDHLIAVPGATAPLRPIQASSSVARRILFTTGKGLLYRKGKIDEQTLRGVRELTPESAGLLNEVIGGNTRITESTGSDWSLREVRETIASYFEMLSRELRGESYVKAEYNRRLRQSLPTRSKQSIEFKFANISAVLDQMNLRFINGFKPRGNFQSSLRTEVERYLADHVGFFGPTGEAPAKAPDTTKLMIAAGLESDPRVRRAVELRAMAMAEEHYRNLGYSVADRSNTESFDLLCEKADTPTLHVEVKGTRGAGESVFVTVNEVKLAENFEGWVLFVVDSISVEMAPIVTATGGQMRILKFAEVKGGLRPSVYRLELPKVRKKSAARD